MLILLFLNRTKIDAFVAEKANLFKSEELLDIKQKMETMSDDRFSVLMSTNLKNPTAVWVVSFICGVWGIDRFLIGEIGLGLAKLFTCGGMGIWWLIDLFTITNKTREANYKKICFFLVE